MPPYTTRPVVGWVAIVQHTLENLVGIVPGPVCAQGSLIIHPGEDDDFRTRIVAKEQAEAPVAEFRSKPVLVLISERRTLTIRGCGRISWYCLKNKFDDRGQKLGVGVLMVIVGLLRLHGLDGLNQFFQLIEEERMGENTPAVDHLHVRSQRPLQSRHRDQHPCLPSGQQRDPEGISGKERLIYRDALPCPARGIRGNAR